jgi:hypothetical protein
MAGVKITDLGPLTTAVSGDLLYIVDISDSTDGPDGTSKKITVGNIAISDEWTPTFSSEFGAVIAVTTTRNYYQKIGSIVTCLMNIEVQVDFSLTSYGDVVFTLPFATSNTDGGGSCSSTNLSKQFNGSIDNNKIILMSEDNTLVGTYVFKAMFQYEIV